MEEHPHKRQYEISFDGSNEFLILCSRGVISRYNSSFDVKNEPGKALTTSLTSCVGT